MKEFFPEIPYIKYEGPKSKNPFAFRYYDPDRVINGKKMREHLKFALSYWHTMCGDGTDMFGRGTFVKNFGAEDVMEVYKNKAYAAFEFMDKLSVDYFCFHDRDIAPEADTLKETNEQIHTKGRETQFLVLRDNEWKINNIHYSQEPEG